MCFKVLKVEKNIRSIQWIHKDFSDHFVSFANAKKMEIPVSAKPNKTKEEGEASDKEEGEEEKVTVKHGFLKTTDPKFSRNVTDDYLLLALLQDNYIMMLGVNEKLEFYHAPILANQDSFSYLPIELSNKERCLLIATGAKDGTCSFWKASANKTDLISSFKYNNFHISSIKFNRVDEQTILCATGSHDRKIVVYEINLNIKEEPTNIQIIPRLLFK